MNMKPKGVKSKTWGMTTEEISPASDSSLAKLINLDTLIFAKPWTMTEARTLLMRQHVFCFMARVDAGSVGYVIVHRKNSSGQVLELAVHPGFRRLGVGRALLKFLDQNLLDSQRTFLEFVVPEDNLDCQLFLKACGVPAVDVIRGQNGDSYLFSANIGFTEPKVLSKETK